MNNPLEAVTQAVNSLVTALKLPDESAKANEVLGEMSFPQFSRLLPYRDYNQESGLFMNDTTMGFMLEAIPINGANESIVEALDHMLRTKLPRGIPLCIHLMSSQLVGDRIEYGLREFSWSGEQAERFNAITRAYYMKAAATQFPLPEGMNLPLTLRHYRVFISYCSPSKKKSRADILEMENLVKIIRASLQGASITTQTVDAQAFIDIVGEMINHNPDSLYPKRRQLDPYSDLNYQCVEDSFDLKVRADYLTLGLRENGRNSTARILNFHLARNPEIAFLWNVADNYSNLLNPELSISCPFILTLTLVVEDQVKTHSEANLKYMDLEKKSKTSYAKWFPSVEKEAKEWGELRQRLGSGQSSVVSYFLNITAFCKDNNETALEVEQDILNSFRKNGFELISPRFNHMRNFLTCLPFMAGKGLFKQLKEAGVVQRAESFNVANLMPLVADIRAMMEGGTAKIYHCNDSDKCLKVVADTPVTISRDNALKSQITKLLASIQNKAVSDTSLDDKEKGFISSTTIPVFKYLVDPQMLGVSNSMIYQLTDYIGYDILLQYIQELIQQARAMVATGNYDEAVIEHINDNMNDATRQIAAFQSQVQVQQDALLVVDRQMSYMRQQLSARMLSRYQNNYHFGGSTL